jgi:hypothetical protein
MYSLDSFLPIMSDELNFMTVMTCFDTIDTYGVSVSCVACATSIKVMHGETRVG